CGGSDGPPTVISGLPTWSVSPGLPCKVSTVPSYGEGTSNRAFAVSTSAIGWSTAMVWPSSTHQVTRSASVRPSPRSGRLKTWVVILALLPRHLGHSRPRCHPTADRQWRPGFGQRWEDCIFLTLVPGRGYRNR